MGLRKLTQSALDRGHLNIAVPVPRFIRYLLLYRPSCSFLMACGVQCRS